MIQQTLIDTVKSSLNEDRSLPFSVYCSVKEQHILNVPVVKPLFIAVLEGEKQLGSEGSIECLAGDFIFLSDSPAINMRNIPSVKEYFALLIEFEPEDFVGIGVENVVKSSEISTNGYKNFTVGEISSKLEKCLQQFIEFSLYAPKSMWSLRRKELLQLLFHLGYRDVVAMASSHKISQKIHTILNKQPAEEIPASVICQQLAMSEATLRRKLNTEGTSIQQIKDQVKLGLGLHLLQTSRYAIGYIAQQCGYQSQSRFSSRFKQRFGLTPSELRKTRMID